MWKKLLLSLYILQEVSNEERHKNGLARLGKGYFKAQRLNPYNPLTYITLSIALVFGIIAFGIVGIWEEIDLRNPFKWV